jgi:hypothetical protein
MSEPTSKTSEVNKTAFVQYRIPQSDYEDLEAIAKIMFEQRAIERPTVANLARFCLYSHHTMDGLLPPLK